MISNTNVVQWLIFSCIWKLCQPIIHLHCENIGGLHWLCQCFLPDGCHNFHIQLNISRCTTLAFDIVSTLTLHLVPSGTEKPTVWNFEICGHLIEDFSLNSLVRIKSLRGIAIDHFSDMSSVGKKFSLKLDLSNHLYPIHSNAFKRGQNACVPNLFVFSNQSLSVTCRCGSF